MRNLITDVPGLEVGHADDARLGSGATAVIFDAPAVASIDVRGGGPGTRETALLDPAQTVEGHRRHHAVRRLGLRPRRRVRRAGLAERAEPRLRGAHRARADRAGGDPVRSAERRRQGLGPLSALSRARLCGGGRRRPDFALGSVGAGTGATTVNCKGGIGSASAQSRDGFIVGALAAVNAAGSVLVGDGPWFWAAPFEQNGEFGGRGLPQRFPPQALEPRTKGSLRENTTLWSSPPTPS